MLNTHRLQMLQWLVRAGFMNSHLSHFFCQTACSCERVLERYLSSRLTSMVSPSNLSSSLSSLCPRLTRASALASLCLASFRNASTTCRSLGPPGLMSMAKKWLKTMLKSNTRPIPIQTNPNFGPSLFDNTLAMVLKKTEAWT